MNLHTLETYDVSFNRMKINVYSYLLKTIGMRMYDEWVFDKSRIEQYWDIQITKTLNVIQNVYNIRLEAERRYLEQQYESKVRRFLFYLRDNDIPNV